MMCPYCKFIGTFTQEHNKDWYCPVCLRRQDEKRETDMH
jgi:hypothetical protein